MAMLTGNIEFEVFNRSLSVSFSVFEKWTLGYKKMKSGYALDLGPARFQFINYNKVHAYIKDLLETYEQQENLQDVYIDNELNNNVTRTFN